MITRHDSGWNGLPIAAVLRERAAQHSEQPCLVGEHGTLSWGELDSQVDRFAAALLEKGLRRADHMALWMANNAFWVIAFLACQRIGVVLIPVNTRYKGDELRYILQQSNAKLLFMMDACFGIDYHALLLDTFPQIAQQSGAGLALAEVPDLRTVVHSSDRELPGSLPIERFLSEPSPSALLAEAEGAVRPGDTALIAYTSGTTGRPKGAMHSHEVMRRVGFVAGRLRVGSEDVILGHMPFYHVGGLFLQLLLALFTGARLVLMSKWDPAEALSAIVRERITQIGGTPTHFYDLINLPARLHSDTSCLRAAWIGGAVDMRAVVNSTIAAFPTLKLLPTYGLTEGTVSATMNTWDDPLDIIVANKSPALGDARIRIVDPDTGHDVAVGARGEIWLAGPLVMQGYYKNPAATRGTITPEGWLRTGDIGILDTQGYLAISDRLKEMFKIGGNNAYPAEIEAYLNTMPEVAESVVVGVPDPRLSEVGFAFVRLKAGTRTTTPEAVVAHCRGRIADYKVPRYVRILERIPTTETGKIARASLKQIALETLNQQVAARA
jgi:fatty-acyl-CoA synthase